MPEALVIVESPAKANTIAGYLGSGYVVESSIGHVRDLPQSAADIPKQYKDQPWARLGIDVDHGFKPLYVVTPDKRKQITKLRKLLATADVLYLATDEDREGEAIAWHLQQVLKPPKRVDVKRMVFHEITAPAIRAAIEAPRDIDRRLVDSQEARRILDRLYGYEVSPVLWKKIQPRLSAGRVQSVATRIVVERERERMAFVAAEYWSLTATFAVAGAAAASGSPREFDAALVSIDERPVATGASFDRAGRLKNEATVRLDEAAARTLIAALADTSFTVRSVEKNALPAAARGAVHDLHPAAGGEPQAAHVGYGGDAHRAVAVREGLHHLHAHRQHYAVGCSLRRGPRHHPRPLRRPVPAAGAAPLMPRRSRMPRRRTKRSGPPATVSACRTRSHAWRRARRRRCTT